jgi:putative ABC transport system permease protein
VQRAALGTSADLPLASTANPLPFAFADEPTTQATDHSARFGAVSASYFAVLGTPLKRGRVFTDRDDTLAPPVAVVNEAFVRRFSRDRDAIGRRLGGRRGPAYEIIGVVGDTHDAGLDVAPEPHIYFSILQRPNVALAVFLRMRAEGAAMEGPLTRAVHAVDPELPVFGVRSMEQAMSASVERRRFALALVSVFGGAALLLAALGTYGVMAFVVQQRTPEFGLRMALGAERRSIMTLVLRPGFAVAARGAALGLAVALVGARLMSSLVFGVSARDPVTFVAVPAVLALAVLAACLVPAWRATRVSPMEALRP